MEFFELSLRPPSIKPIMYELLQQRNCGELHCSDLHSHVHSYPNHLVKVLDMIAENTPLRPAPLHSWAEQIAHIVHNELTDITPFAQDLKLGEIEVDKTYLNMLNSPALTLSTRLNVRFARILAVLTAKKAGAAVPVIFKWAEEYVTDTGLNRFSLATLGLIYHHPTFKKFPIEKEHYRASTAKFLDRIEQKEFKTIASAAADLQSDFNHDIHTPILDTIKDGQR